MLDTGVFSRAPGARLVARCRRGLIAAAALVTLAAPVAALPVVEPASASARTGPALWVVSDADTTIYLFGTFHSLDRDTSWFAARVRAAFDQSDELVLETVIPSDPAELHDALVRQRLAKPIVAGQPVVDSDRAPDFVASAGKAMAAGRELGMSVEFGADAVLRRTADALGKKVDGLESFEFQLGMFAGLPKATAAAPATATPLPVMLNDMRSAWRRGDASRFSTILGSVEQASPAAYRTLFADRNARWADWLEARMDRPGTIFVAVGTGHLIGRDSVQAKLAQRGLLARRIG